MGRYKAYVAATMFEATIFSVVVLLFPANRVVTTHFVAATISKAGASTINKVYVVVTLFKATSIVYHFCSRNSLGCRDCFI